MEADLAAGDRLVILVTADHDLPELVRPALMDRLADDAQAAGAVCPEEVGGVRDADDLLAAIPDGLEGADRRATRSEAACLRVTNARALAAAGRCRSCDA